MITLLIVGGGILIGFLALYGAVAIIAALIDACRGAFAEESEEQEEQEEPDYPAEFLYADDEPDDLRQAF